MMRLRRITLLKGSMVACVAFSLIAGQACAATTVSKDTKKVEPVQKKAAAPSAKDAAKVTVKPVAQKKIALYPAPAFTLQDIRQDQVSLSDYKGKSPVMLFFWTTWCPFCQRELQVLNPSYPQMAKDGVELLAVNVGELPDRVIAAVNSYHLQFRVLLDKDGSVSDAYAVIGVPTYVLINIDGMVVFKDNYFPAGYKDLLKG